MKRRRVVRVPASSANLGPGYDAFGWLVWGRQVLHWNLNTDGAPSWKPLPFLFTLPYALFGRSGPWLWSVTAVAEAPGGAHPSYAHGYSDRDNDYYREWDEISRDRDRFTRWLDGING